MHAKPPPAVTALPHVEPPSLLASVGGERERAVELWPEERKKRERKKGKRKGKKKEKRKHK
jgi:hypothetical protein